MARDKKKKRQTYRKLRTKYRLVIMNDDTFEEKISMILSPLNVFTWGGLILLLLIAIVTGLIAFTPLREIIPGYADVDTRNMATYAALKADSLDRELKIKNAYLDNLQSILQGNPVNANASEEKDTTINYKNIELGISHEDSLLRAEIEAEEQYNLSFLEENTSEKSISSFFFFTPLRGLVSSGFDMDKEHFGVDVIAPKNEAVKATLDGTVIFATWTSETGHVIQLQHENNLVSVYKHNSVVLKKAGDYIKAGEAIAIIGESGELSEGPHLHFELWFNGRPIDPQQYMVF